MSTFGLEGILPWHQARSIAANAAHALASAQARLDEAAGTRLARDLLTLRDDPAEDCAAYGGFAICGPGPWFVS